MEVRERDTEGYVNHNQDKIKVIEPSEHRKYTANIWKDNECIEQVFEYTTPPLVDIKFEDAIGVSGTSGFDECGLQSVIQGDKIYNSGFGKQANAFRTNQAMWDNYSRSFNIKIEDYRQHIFNEPVNQWFTTTGHYWHYFCEDLPTIRALRENSYPIIVNPLKSWQKEALEFFPDILERMIEIEIPCSFRSPEIHVFTHPSISNRGKSAKWAARYLKQNMISDEYAYSIKNIYISRADANARHIENENDLMKVLEKYDFKRYNLTSLTLCEKISLFAGAENIVGPTGAGFTHLLFANSPNVIDFNHAFEVNEECGWNNLGDVNNATWHTIAAEKSLPPSSERPKAKNGNMIVNAKTAETVLKLLQHS